MTHLRCLRAERVVLRRGALRVEITLRPFAFTVRRAGPAAAARRRRLGRRRRDPRPVRAVHRGGDRPRGAGAGRAGAAGRRSSRSQRRRRARPAPGAVVAPARLRIELRGDERWRWSSSADGRAAAARRSSGTAAPRSASSGSGARHCTAARPGRARRSSSAPTAATPGPTARRRCSPTAGSRRATARRCRGCSPAAATAVWVQTDANGTLLRSRGRAGLGVARGRPRVRCALRLLCDPTPGGAAARVLPPDRLSRAAARVGLRILEEPRRARAPGRRDRRLRGLPPPRDPARRDRDRLAVGDPVQHLGVQPAPVPRRAGDGRDDARGRRADGRVGDAVGQPRLPRRADPAAAGVRAPAPRAGPQLRAGRGGGTFRPGAGRASRSCAQWWMGTGSPIDFTSPAAERWWREQAKRVLELGVEGIKADDGDGYYIPDDVRLADGRTGAQAAWALGGLHRRCAAARARRGPSRARRAVRAQRLERPAGDRADLGRRPGIGLLVAAGARGGHAEPRPAAASPTGRTTSAAISGTGWSSAARPSCWSAGCSSAASRR